MSSKVFSGIRVVEFTVAITGSLMGRYLAMYGATVIKVESQVHVDLVRLTPPYQGGKVDPDRSGTYTLFNGGKLDIAINLKTQRGRDLARRLALTADILIENFAPGVLERSGLGFESLRKDNPGLIMLSSSNQGQTGPYSRQPGLGTNLTSLVGFSDLTGWPDRLPSQPYGAYTDFIGPHFGTVALIAALDHRRRTGEGQYLDLSQLEAGMHFVAPLVLDYFVSDRWPTRSGNRNPEIAPHGVYPCRGTESWVAIVVKSEGTWRRFLDICAVPELQDEDLYGSMERRKGHEDELDRLIAGWTATQEARPLVERLQAAGISAGVIQNGQELFEDEQLRHRGYFVPTEHPKIGLQHYLANGFTLSECEAELTHAPTIGEHTEYVCRELLGISDEELVELLQDNVLS